MSTLPHTWRGAQAAEQQPARPESSNMRPDVCLPSCLTPAEAAFFARYGYLKVKGALTKERVAQLAASADRI